MKDDANETILHELLKMRQESSERDTKLETSLVNISDRLDNQEKRLEKQDVQIEKLTEILAAQKNNEFRINNLEESMKKNSERIDNLEKKSGQVALSVWKKIGITALTSLVTAAVAFILAKIF